MELRLLRYFLAVAREENITRAAQSLHLSQPALSKQLIELEQELGTQLFTRGKRKITLTEEGMLFRKRADEILLLCEKAEREVSQKSELLSGEISIGGAASPTVTTVISHMFNKYPHIKFQLINGDAHNIEEHLENGTLDFGVLIDPVDLSKYEHIPLKDTAVWGLLMHRDSPLAQKSVICPQDIANIPLIMPRRPGLQQYFSTWSGIAVDKLNIVAEFDILFNSTALLLKNNLGCAFALNTIMETDKNSDICFRPLQDSSEIHYSLVWKRYPVFSKASKKFIEEIYDLVTHTQ